jgi:hypothetical protein
MHKIKKKMQLPKIMINWKPEGSKKRGRPWKDGIYTAMSEGLSMGEWNNLRQWNMEVGRRFKTAQHIQNK